jgi:hypothetical protein
MKKKSSFVCESLGLFSCDVEQSPNQHLLSSEQEGFVDNNPMDNTLTYGVKCGRMRKKHETKWIYLEWLKKEICEFIQSIPKEQNRKDVVYKAYGVYFDDIEHCADRVNEWYSKFKHPTFKGFGKLSNRYGTLNYIETESNLCQRALEQYIKYPCDRTKKLRKFRAAELKQCLVEYVSTIFPVIENGLENDMFTNKYSNKLYQFDDHWFSKFESDNNLQDVLYRACRDHSVGVGVFINDFAEARRTLILENGDTPVDVPEEDIEFNRRVGRLQYGKKVLFLFVLYFIFLFT